jgi:hypothetical protein
MSTFVGLHDNSVIPCRESERPIDILSKDK